MASVKKGILGLMAFIMVMLVCTMNVSAKAFEDIISDLMAADGYTINATDEALTYGGEDWIGPNGRITIDSGSATVLLDDGRFTITLNGEATINTGKQFIMQLEFNPGTGVTTYPVTLNIPEESTLNVLGNLAIPSGSEGLLNNAGTLNVSGKLEVRNDGTLTSTGAFNLTGNLAVYGDGLGTSVVNVFEDANVYSQVDLASNITIAEQNTTEGFTWNVVDNSKEYTSFTDSVGTVTFAYGYTLDLIEDTPTVPEDPVEEPDEPTTPTDPVEEPDEPTTPTDPVEEPTQPSEPVIENPSTLDNISVFMILGAISVIGLTVATVVLKKKHN